jgi:hypothetical protein
MKRLMLKIVFSGLVIACRRAIWPTRRSPVLGLVATTDGVRRLPSAFSRTVGSPASRIAVTEFVVPRSMPMTLAMVMVMSPIPWRTRHNYLCRPQKVCSESITRSQDVLDLWLGCAFLLAKLDCLVYRWIEFLARTANPLNAHLAQRPQEALISKSDSFCPRVIAQVLGRVDKSAVKIIDRRQQLAQHFVARMFVVSLDPLVANVQGRYVRLRDLPGARLFSDWPPRPCSRSKRSCCSNCMASLARAAQPNRERKPQRAEDDGVNGDQFQRPGDERPHCKRPPVAGGEFEFDHQGAKPLSEFRSLFARLGTIAQHAQGLKGTSAKTVSRLGLDPNTPTVDTTRTHPVRHHLSAGNANTTEPCLGTIRAGAS